MPTGYRIRLNRTRKRRGKIRDRRTMPTSPRPTSMRRRQDLLRRRRTTTATTIRSMRRRRRWLGARISERYKDSLRNTIRRSRSSSCNCSRNRSKSSHNSSRSRSHSNSQSLLRPGPRPQVRSISLRLSLTAASETDSKCVFFHLARRRRSQSDGRERRCRVWRCHARRDARQLDGPSEGSACCGRRDSSAGRTRSCCDWRTDEAGWARWRKEEVVKWRIVLHAALVGRRGEGLVELLSRRVMIDCPFVLSSYALKFVNVAFR